MAAVLLWSYWPTLALMAERWENDPQYSHGFLVPLFALVVLWLRRPAPLKTAGPTSGGTTVLGTPSWWGLVLIGAAVLMRVEAASMDIEVLDGMSMLPMLAGIVLLCGGWNLFKWTWPAIGFLAFMLPLPYTLEQSLAVPLRGIATRCSAYLLETLGYPAVTEGNIIWIDDVRLGVIDACSGLGMLMTFFALATALALVIQNDWKDKLVLVFSAVPIAVAVNVIRITATGVAYVHFGSASVQAILHDLAGWLMMPLALALLWLELRFIENLFIPVEKAAPLAVAGVHRSAPLQQSTLQQSSVRQPRVPL